MPDFRLANVAKCLNTAVAHNPAADARTDGRIENRATPRARPEVSFGQRRQLAIILNAHRQAEFPFERRDHGKPVPAVFMETQVRLPCRSPNRPAEAEADGAKRRPLLFVALAKFPPGLDQPIQTTLGPVRGLSIKDARLHQPPIRPGNPGNKLRSAGFKNKIRGRTHSAPIPAEAKTLDYTYAPTKTCRER